MRKYTIPQGFHISHVLPSFHKDLSVFQFDFCFSSTCIYEIKGENNFDVNKLYGLGFGLIHSARDFLYKIFPEKAQSVRLGWNCEKNNGAIQLHAYYYNDGVRYIDYLCDIPVKALGNAYFYFDRSLNKLIFDITIGEYNLSRTYDFRFVDCKRWGFILDPFFGGDESAPHRMNFYINRV